MKSQISMLLIALSLCPLATPATQTAQVRLYCGSLQFNRGQSETGASLDVTTTLPVLNGELQPYPYAGGNYDYTCILQLNGLYGSIPPDPPMLGAMALNLPPFGDANTNGYPDFFEVACGAALTNTLGEFLLPAGGGTVVAAWTRTAGSPTGTCELVFTFDLVEAPVTFTHQFTLLEYKGTLAYTSASNNVTGAISLAQTGYPANSLGGPVQFTKPTTNWYDQLTLNAGTWTNGNAQIVSYPAVALNWFSSPRPTNYSALVELSDGYPQTSAPDYRLWVISIDDTNDTDLDGIPDIADTPLVYLPRAPYLTMTGSDSNLSLTISGDVGRQHLIQESDSLAPVNWQTVGTLTLMYDPEIVLLPLPSAMTKFWRVIAQ